MSVHYSLCASDEYRGAYFMVFGYRHTHIYITYNFTGESGLVYRGYIEREGYKDMVAIKTCKGMKHYFILKLIVNSDIIICIP